MIQIELPCCDAPVDLPAEGETVRCEACGIEHLLAPDARPIAEAPRLIAEPPRPLIDVRVLAA